MIRYPVTSLSSSVCSLNFAVCVHEQRARVSGNQEGKKKKIRNQKSAHISCPHYYYGSTRFSVKGEDNRSSEKINSYPPLPTFKFPWRSPNMLSLLSFFRSRFLGYLFLYFFLYHWVIELRRVSDHQSTGQVRRQ